MFVSYDVNDKAIDLLLFRLTVNMNYYDWRITWPYVYVRTYVEKQTASDACTYNESSLFLAQLRKIETFSKHTVSAVIFSWR